MYIDPTCELSESVCFFADDIQLHVSDLPSKVMIVNLKYALILSIGIILPYVKCQGHDTC